MRINDNLKRGSVELLILTLLNEEDMYGYQIAQELSKRSDGMYTIAETSLYPIFYRMIDKGLISDRRELVGKRRFRVYYHIEPAGLEQLERSTAEYISFMSSILKILGKRVVDDEK